MGGVAKDGMADFLELREGGREEEREEGRMGRGSLKPGRQAVLAFLTVVKKRRHKGVSTGVKEGGREEGRACLDIPSAWSSAPPARPDKSPTENGARAPGWEGGREGGREKR